MYGFLICGKMVKLTYFEFNDVSSSLAASVRVALFIFYIFYVFLLCVRLSALLLSVVLSHFRQENLLVFYFLFCFLLQTVVTIFVLGLGCCCAIRTV